MAQTTTIMALAARTSTLVVDSDLDMGGFKVKPGLRPLGWNTIALDWPDIPAGEVETLGADVAYIAGDGQKTVKSFVSDNRGEWSITGHAVTTVYACTMLIFVNGVEQGGESFGTAQSPKTLNVNVNAGDVIDVKFLCTSGFTIKASTNWQYTGYTHRDELDFNLTDKWLAVGIDMHDLEATIEINGVMIPYSDYEKYFPIAPTKLTIPGDWEPTQIRPEILVYD